MQRLCAVTALILFSTFVAFGASGPQVQINSLTTQTTGQATIEKKPGENQTGQTLGVQVTSPRLKSGLQITTTYNQIKNDYSSYVIQDQNGTEKKLGSTFQQSESQGSLALDVSFQNLSASLSVDSSLGPTPFPSRFYQLTQTTQFNHQLTEVSWSLGSGKMEQPLSYFTDVQSGERKQRPTTLDFRTYAISAEQVVSEHLRAQIQLEANQRSDRPTATGLQIQSAYAVSERDFLRLHLLRRQESRQDRLQDDRGYFDLSGGEISYSRYLTYDLVGSAGYGLIVEREDQPARLRKDQLATDVYTLKLDYQGVKWSGGLKFQQMASNLEYSSSSYGGQFAWNF